MTFDLEITIAMTFDIRNSLTLNWPLTFKWPSLIWSELNHWSNPSNDPSNDLHWSEVTLWPWCDQSWGRDIKFHAQGYQRKLLMLPSTTELIFKLWPSLIWSDLNHWSDPSNDLHWSEVTLWPWDNQSWGRDIKFHTHGPQRKLLRNPSTTELILKLYDLSQIVPIVSPRVFWFTCFSFASIPVFFVWCVENWKGRVNKCMVISNVVHWWE